MAKNTSKGVSYRSTARQRDGHTSGIVPSLLAIFFLSRLVVTMAPSCLFQCPRIPYLFQTFIRLGLPFVGNAVHCCTSATNRQCWLSCTHCCRCCSGMLVAVSDASLPSRCVPLTFTPFIHSSAHDCCHCQLSSLLPRLLLCCFLRLSRYFIHQLFCCLTAGAPGPPAAVASAVLQVLLIHRSAAVAVLYSHYYLTVGHRPHRPFVLSRFLP